MERKVRMRVDESMKDFMEGYVERKYSGICEGREWRVEKWCMRYEEKGGNGGDLYGNLGGGKIVVGRDERRNVVGGGIVWKEIRLWK